MILDYLRKIAPRNPWHYLWIAIISSEIITFLLGKMFSFIFWGETSEKVLIIGVVDAFIVPLMVTPVVIYFIVSEQRRVENELNELSYSDELTKLKNRRGFFILAEQQLKLSNRNQKGIFMLYTDIDNFKQINDTFGHEEGDKVLKEVAGILQKNYRTSDIISRIGGDEFVVIPIETSKSGVNVVIERFQNALALHNEKVKRDYDISVSTGLAYYNPISPCSLDELLSRADKIMYKEKERKKTIQETLLSCQTETILKSDN